MLALIPFGFVVAVTVFDLVTPDDVHYGVLLILAPMIAAMVGGPWLTAGVGLLAVCVQAYIAAHLNVLAVHRDEALQIIATTALSTLVVALSRIRERRLRQMEQIRSVSEAAQRALMRPLPNRLGPLRVASFYLAAADQAEIGGDLYTATLIPGAARMIIGDVRGKGLTAVGESALLIGAFRQAADSHASLGELAAALDLSVSRYLADFVDDYAHAAEHFITALLLHIPGNAATVEITNCGHPPPLLIHNGEVRFLDSSNPVPPLGMHVLSVTGYTADTFAFEAGDTLLLYTDGVIEARNRDGEFYPLPERVEQWAGGTPEVLVERLKHDLLGHCGGRLGDDAAAIAIRRPEAGD
ncbi:PP2C family protein-serine/threonine phosphatase [Streptacidiphilus jiangxiensis]|uniref:Serine phosphatase RsbU, regulator of sigma subunit n=1 Tax=Streptacidiphilus jiangxiensis TaxID=235985 RepID=A0A1H7P1Q2_STRJI|nr:PP2C family protein-serine/threonine phosphatase [Streptacidiphilus jiangxiensis]SEL29566.1 Serine phosphatase RsbU, regulator of sigma subunit [Streptacidiphilus jiangxiensis]